MNFEKLVNSKINVFADWIIRLVTINLMVIVCSLPVITIYPAISAGYNMFHDYTKGENVKLFSGFFGYFKKDITRKMLIGFIIGFSVTLGFLNVRYYSTILETSPSTFYQIGYYVTLALLAALYAVSVCSIVVVKVYPRTRLITLFKLSFIIAGKYYFRTLVLLIVNSAVFLLLIYPPTAMIFIFMGVSLVLLVDSLITRDIVFFLSNFGDKND